LACQLREIENKARNIAAHEIIAINENWIYQTIDCSAKDILKMLKIFFGYCCPVPKDAWNSYDQLNQAIMSHL